MGVCQVDITFYFDGEIEIMCSTSGSGIGYGAGYCDSGGCSYYFPEEESMDYLNLIAFIREKTWIKNNFYEILTREEYESILNEISYTE